MPNSAIPAFATLGEMLRYLRRRARLTQRELSIAVGYSDSQISRLEQNERQIDVATLLAVFVPAFQIEDQPELMQSLMKLASAIPAPYDPEFSAMGAENSGEIAKETVVTERLSLYPSVENARLDNLPKSFTPFIGRERELAELDVLLADRNHRMISMVGPGGIGKTRLALEIARRKMASEGSAASSFIHGVYFVAVAPLSEATQLIPAVAEATGLRLESSSGAGRTPREQILDYLAEKQMLIVMDNFEHFVDETTLVADIVRTAAKVQLLITSRERLRLPGEQLYRLQGLDLGQATWSSAAERPDAIQLFVQCAQRAIPNLAFSNTEIEDVREICRLVETMPLALEMAAAWMDTLTPAEIRQEIHQDLDFLASKERGIAERHQSMRAVFDATWRRLSESEQRIFASLSIFRGGFTREAAQVVADATLHQLSQLSDKSLIQHYQGIGRFNLHELLRQYGALRLAEQPSLEMSVRDRQSRYYAAYLQRFESALQGKEQRAALMALDPEQANLSVAWHWSVRQVKIDQLALAMKGLGLYFRLRFLAEEGITLFHLAGEVLQQRDEMRYLVSALTWQASFALLIGRFDEAELYLQRSLNLLNHSSLVYDETRFERALVFWQMGALDFARGSWTHHHHYDLSLALFEELGESWFAAQVLMGMAAVTLAMGNYRLLEAQTQKALALYRKVGNERGIATALSLLADSEILSGRLESGLDGNLQSLAVFRSLGDTFGAGISLRRIGTAYMFLGQIAEGRQALLESASVLHAIGSRWEESVCYYTLWTVEMMAGDYACGLRYAQHALEMLGEIGDHPLVGMYLTAVGSATLYTGSPTVALATLQKAATMMDNSGGGTVDTSLSYALLSFGEWRNALRQLAHTHCLVALRLAVQGNDPLPVSIALSVGMEIIAEAGNLACALELYTLLKRYAFCGSGAWWLDTCGAHVDAVVKGLPAAFLEGAISRGERLELWETTAQLIQQLQEVEVS